MEARFFAAQTLSTKLVKDKSLSGDQVLPLVERLLRHAREYFTERYGSAAGGLLIPVMSNRLFGVCWHVYCSSIP
jgi:hypothetical protein